jgi:integrase
MIWVKDAGGQRRQVWGGTFRTKAEAKAAERELLQKRDSGSDLKKSKLTVVDICEQYLAEKAGKGKASSRQRSQELLAHIVRALGSKSAVNLRPADVSAAYKRLEETLSKRTVRHVHWQLHAALELSVRWGQIPINAASRVSPPTADSFEARALSKDEVTSLLTSVRGKPLGPLVMTALDTGAREGELLALRWTDLDLDRGIAHISRSVRRSKGKWEFSEPKTKRSRRAVGISAPTVAMLKSHRQHQLERRLRLGEAWTDLDLVFPTGRGTPQNATEVSKSFRKLAAEAGFEGLRFHDLRHSSVSLLLGRGESMADVSRRVGHSGIGTTVDTYGHLLGTAPSLAATMGSILENSVKDPDGWLANG